MVLSKMEYWKYTKRECRKNHLTSKPPSTRIPQTNMRVNNKFERQVLTETWDKVYVNNTVPKRAYVFKIMQSLRNCHIFDKASTFMNSMKYFTMTYGYPISDLTLFHYQFQMLNRKRSENNQM